MTRQCLSQRELFKKLSHGFQKCAWSILSCLTTISMANYHKANNTCNSNEAKKNHKA